MRNSDFLDDDFPDSDRGFRILKQLEEDFGDLGLWNADCGMRSREVGIRNAENNKCSFFNSNDSQSPDKVGLGHNQ
jgi:hypothetical protein